MQFQPKTDKEISEMNLWPVGVYGFEILENVTLGSKLYETKDTMSKNDNEMIQLVVKVYNDEGQFKVIVDYLLESTAAKLRHAAEACGLVDQYESGRLVADDFKGKTGNLKLKIDKDKTGQYPDKNGIADYVVPDGNALSYAPPPGHPASLNGGFVDDTIPFDRIRGLA